MALVKIGQPAVPALIGALKNPDKRVRTHTASALARMGEQAKAAIPALIAALKDKDTNVRSSAAFALGRMGEQAKVAIPALIAALKTPDKDVRRYAALALENIAVSLQEKAKANALSKSDLEPAITNLEAALDILENPENKFSIRLIDAVRLPLNVLKAKQNAHLFNWILQNAWVWIPGMYIVSVFGVFWIRPLWLLKIDEIFKQLDFKVSVLGVEKSLQPLLFLNTIPECWMLGLRHTFSLLERNFRKRIHLAIALYTFTLMLNSKTNLASGSRVKIGPYLEKTQAVLSSGAKKVQVKPVWLIKLVNGQSKEVFAYTK